MLKKLSKESKVQVLENFYGLDYVFFNKPIKELDYCCPALAEEYINLKGALMSIFVEMLKLMEHDPEKIEGKIDVKQIRENASVSADRSRFAASKLMQTKAAMESIKDSLMENIAITESEEGDDAIEPKEFVEFQIKTKSFALAVDNLMLAKPLSEANDVNAMVSFEGNLLEDSYKILRDGLCECALIIME
jgi:hypothetical protein